MSDRKTICDVMRKHVEIINECEVPSLMEMNIREAMIEAAERAYLATVNGTEAKYFITEEALNRIKENHED